MELYLIGLIRSDIVTYIPEYSNCLSVRWDQNWKDK